MKSFDQFPKYKKVAIAPIFLRFAITKSSSINTLVFKQLQACIATQTGGAVDLFNEGASASLGVKCLKFANPQNYDCLVVFMQKCNVFGGIIPKLTYWLMDFLKDFDGDVFFFLENPKALAPRSYIDWMFNYSHIGNKKNSRLKVYLKDIPTLKSKLDNAGFISDVDFTSSTVKSPKTEFCQHIIKSIREGKTEFYQSNIAEAMSVDAAWREDCYATKIYDISLAINEPWRHKIAKQTLDSPNISVEVVQNTHTLTKGETRAVVHVVTKTGNLASYYKHICQKCFATLICTGLSHINSIVPERIYTTFKSYIVGFIPLVCDPDKHYVKGEELRQFSYVSSPIELEQKLAKLRNKQFYEHILELQRQEVEDD